MIMLKSRFKYSWIFKNTTSYFFFFAVLICCLCVCLPAGQGGGIEPESEETWSQIWGSDPVSTKFLLLTEMMDNNEK